LKQLFPVALLLASSLGATTYTFTFNGTYEPAAATITENGSFTFADGLKNVALSNLTSFSMTENWVGFPGPYTDTFGLPDVTQFSLTQSAGVPSYWDIVVKMPSYPEALAVDTAITNGAFWGFVDVGGVGSGTLTDPPAPEPVSMALFGLGLMGVFAAKRRKAYRPLT